MLFIGGGFPRNITNLAILLLLQELRTSPMGGSGRWSPALARRKAPPMARVPRSSPRRRLPTTPTPTPTPTWTPMSTWTPTPTLPMPPLLPPWRYPLLTLPAGHPRQLSEIHRPHVSSGRRTTRRPCFGSGQMTW